MKAAPTAQELLRGAKLRRTRGRTAILAVLAEAERPLTQEEIAARLAETPLDRVTIYRALESFVKADLVHKTFAHDNVWHFELAHRCTQRQCHPHFCCRSCGAMHCLPEVHLPLAQVGRRGFVVQRQQVRLEGLCRTCNPDAV